MKILVTGAAGFIGSKLIEILAADKEYEIIGLDNINTYYDVELKYDRLEHLTGIERYKIKEGKFVQSNIFTNYRFLKASLEDQETILDLFKTEKFNIVCNLAAQAGVRYSIENPKTYIDSNILGFLNILEGCRYNNIEHLIYASSSSVYGLNEKVPFSELDEVSHPVSLYAATKRANELMAHSYSSLYNIPSTGLRFFTVYGPWGRPDMAPFLFTDAILKYNPIKVFNNGDMLRDFTFIDDIIDGIIKVIKGHMPTESVSKDTINLQPCFSRSPFILYNIGNSTPIKLMDFIESLEREIGQVAKKIFLPMQPGDVYQTNADMTRFTKEFNYKPDTSIDKGVHEFVKWYRIYYS